MGFSGKTGGNSCAILFFIILFLLLFDGLNSGFRDAEALVE